MKIALSIEKAHGKLIFYGLGCAKAFGGYRFMRDRQDLAFNGRIESFVFWINSSFEEILTQY